MDLFRPFGAPSPCAGKARDLLRSCSAEGNGPKRRDVFRLEARSDCPEGWGPTPKALHSGCQNAAAGGETSLLHAADWVTFSCALKPEYIPQRLLRLFTSSLRVTACRLPFSRLRRQLPRPHPSAFGCHLPQRGRLWLPLSALRATSPERGSCCSGGRVPWRQSFICPCG